ncbi:ferric reductase [Scheffersomyces xylosifermentans]|uniref:ferric reductase n=1 Tax=Scheffersomyces xylosifermentans TaxID=1304137 RepID=UPI00315C65F0
MYIWAVYVSFVVLVLLTPFLIPTRTQNPWHRKSKVVLSIALLVSSIIALTPEAAVNGAPLHKYGQAKIAYLGCNYQILSTASFCPAESGEYDQSCYCTNINALATISHCYKYGHPKEVTSLLDMCREEYNVTVTPSQFEEAHQYYLHSAKPVDGVVGCNHTSMVNFPVKLNDSQILLYKGAYQQFLGNYDLSMDYGAYVVLYWIAVFVIAAIGNWSKIIVPGIYRNILTDPFSNWFRKNISLPATRRKSKTNEKKFLKVLDFLVPTRAETLILTTFSALCIYLIFNKIHYFEGDPLFHSKKLALLRYVGVRASVLTSSLMPLLILFGGRNNFLQWFTRWDYSTFITLHRWLSRVIFVMVVVHAVCYSLYLRPQYRKGETLESYIIWGGVATVAGLGIMVQGLLVLRRKWYEMFLLIHIILATVFIIGAWVHVLDLYCTWFYYYTTMIWIFDRVIRIGRLISFGFPQAEVHLEADETLRVVVAKPSHWEVIPGGHAFIHFLRPSCFWQSHPFTYTIDTHDSDKIVLFIKVKNGVTSSLYDYLVTHPRRSTSIRVAIEGSYGEKTPASRYDNAVFIAGGNGIPGIYSEAYDLVKKSNNKRQKVNIIWVVREYKSLCWFYEELLSLKGTPINTTIYVTRPHSRSFLHEFHDKVKSGRKSSTVTYENSTEMVGFRGEDFVTRIRSELSHIEFKEGRPNIGSIVKSCIKESTSSTCFVTCGHPVMVDEIRAAVVDNIGNEDRKRVDYFEQLQVWA